MNKKKMKNEIKRLKKEISYLNNDIKVLNNKIDNNAAKGRIVIKGFTSDNTR